MYVRKEVEHTAVAVEGQLYMGCTTDPSNEDID